MDYSHLLSDRLKSLGESATLKMTQLGRELKAQGHNVISLSIGEPDFDTPDFIKNEAKNGLDQGYTKYTPVSGLPEFKKAIQDKFKRDNDLDYDLGQIVVSNGAKQSIANVCLSLLGPGDDCIIFTPYWVSYIEIVKFTGANPILVKAGIDQDFKITPEQLEKAITDDTKLIIYSSPSNPTGAVYSRKDLKELADVILRHNNLFVLSDEIYEHINYIGKVPSMGNIPGMMDRTITVNGMAKGFAMTGWRIGYIGAPEWIAKACTKIQGQFTSGANAFSQYASARALDHNLEESYKMRDTFESRKKLMIKMLSEIPGVKVSDPDGAFYVFPDISYYFGKTNGNDTILDSESFAMQVLNNAHVSTVAGSAFGDNNCIRISYAASDENLKEAVRRIKNFLADFK